MPAIYEHKGALVGKSPSEICRNADFLYAGLKREAELYDADMLVIGIDVYNVEAEALGCKVEYFENSNNVPAIVEPLISGPADLGRLGLPDPSRDGRMPVYLDVAARLGRELGPEMILRGAVTGPFSLATSLMGLEIAVEGRPEWSALGDPCWPRPFTFAHGDLLLQGENFKHGVTSTAKEDSDGGED